MYRVDTNITNLSSAGSGEGRIYNNNSAVILIILQLSLITSPTASGCTCKVSPPIGFVDTSYFAGTGDTAIGSYVIQPGEFLKLEWSGGPASGQGQATYFFEERLI